MGTCSNCRLDNPDGANFCSRCGARMDAPRPVEGERKVASVLFADVVGSTSLAEGMDAEDWAAIMNGAFAFMNAEISRYGGTVARLMGDAVLAFFGAPVAQEDHAERAVRAGLALVEAGREYARAIGERYGIEFELRVGIHTGTAVLAFMGDDVKGEYTAMGDTANVAARLQSAARPGTVLIGEPTHRLVRGVFEVRDRGPLAMKGKREPVPTFEVVALLAVPGRRRGIEGLHSPLVGRDREAALIRSKLEAVTRRVGATVAVVGEAGLGKSRLVAEIREAAGGAVVWCEGRAISYGQALAYHPWQQVGRAMIGISPSASPAETREAMRSFLDRAGVASEHAPLLETMLAVETAESRAAVAGLEEDGLVHRIADAVVACIRGSIHASGSPRPHVIALDDLHWADTASIELAAQVATLTASEPLLLVCLLRPDRKAPSWSLLERLELTLGPSYDEMVVAPLDEADARTLLGHLLHIEDLPDSVRALILRKSDGNPFFIEEVLRSLMDSGHVVQEDGRWRARGDIVDVTIPDTLAGVLAARIDRLPGATKRVAQTAAVLGRIFPYRALSTACRAAPAPDRIENVEPHLGTLSYEELVRERARDPEREYIFKHALTQETAYGLLLRESRRALHLRAGQALEESFPDKTEELAPLLARHFDEGGDARRAAEYSLRAASRARQLYALREAAEHLDRAWDALNGMENPPDDLLVDAILEWALVRYKMTVYDGVAERLLRAEGAARQAGDEPRLARVLLWLGLIYMVMGFPSRAGPYMSESSRLAKALGMEQLMLLPFFFATEQLIDESPTRAVEQFDQVIEQARQDRMPEVVGHALASSAIALARLGDFERARQRIGAALEAAPSGGHRVKEADVHLLVGAAYYEMGETETGLEHTRLGTELSVQENALECACAGHFFVGLGELVQHDAERARTSFEESVRYGERAGWDGWSGFRNRIAVGAALAELRAGSGDAVAALERALENARSDHDVYFAAMVSETLAQVHLEQGDPKSAAERLASALDYYREAGMHPYLSRGLELAARIADRDGRAEDAAQARAEAQAPWAPPEPSAVRAGGGASP
jgi:class 3 adenylate cyclase/tetratricopeptide (TPR) repeat protein